MVRLGALAVGAIATADEHGGVALDDGPRVDWRVRSGDRWIDPREEAAVRARRPTAAPVRECALRTREGDVVQRAYAVEDGVVVLELDNESRADVAIALDLPPNAAARDDVVAVGRGWSLVLARRPAAIDGSAVVFPLPHGASMRVALARRAVDVRALPGAATTTRAWEQLLEHGMRAELPEPEQLDVNRARADVLLAAPSADSFTALEAWGFDREATAMWARLGTIARRRARRPRQPADAVTSLLLRTRDALVGERRRGVAMFPGFRPEWLGSNLAVHDAPLRTGRCSFALRWHGARPALLWEVPDGAAVTAPALDPAWSSTRPRGEVLLGEPPAALLAWRSTAGHTTGDRIDAPESFA